MQNFDSELLELFRKEEQRGTTDLRRELGVGNFSGKLDDFTAKLTLLGGWDDSNCEDRKLIEEFFGLKFAEFQKKAQLLICFPYMSKKDHIWKISDQKMLYKMSEKYYTDDDIVKLFSCIRSIVFSYGEKKIADEGRPLKTSIRMHPRRSQEQSATGSLREHALFAVTRLNSVRRTHLR